MQHRKFPHQDFPSFEKHYISNNLQNTEIQKCHNDIERKQLRLSYPNISFEELSFGYIECTNDGCEHYRHKLTDLFYAWNIHDEEWHIDSQEFVNAFNNWSIDSKEYTCS